MSALREPTPACPDVVLMGGCTGGGAYLLRIRVERTVEVAFGRFKGGKRIRVPAGLYVYVGSARAEKGPASLPLRLIRHATRSLGKPHHRIRDRLVKVVICHAMVPSGLTPPVTKRLHWHVDHLLDRTEAEITGVIAVRTRRDLEPVFAELLERDPCARALERGLGASDWPGATHLYRVEAQRTWWDRLPDRLVMML